jgi:hypothetical protein
VAASALWEKPHKTVTKAFHFTHSKLEQSSAIVK